MRTVSCGRERVDRCSQRTAPWRGEVASRPGRGPPPRNKALPRRASSQSGPKELADPPPKTVPYPSPFKPRESLPAADAMCGILVAGFASLCIWSLLHPWALGLPSSPTSPCTRKCPPPAPAGRGGERNRPASVPPKVPLRLSEAGPILQKGARSRARHRGGVFLAAMYASHLACESGSSRLCRTAPVTIRRRNEMPWRNCAKGIRGRRTDAV